MNDLLTKVLPWIGAAATGNVPALVSMAAKTLGDAMGSEVKPTAEAIGQAIAGATPEQLQAARAADAEFALKMQAMGFAHAEELARVAASDRANARDREIKTGDSSTPRIIAALVVLGWLAVQAFLLTNVIDATMRELVARVLGTLDGALMLVLGYYFGSSAGSRENQEALRDAARSE